MSTWILIERNLVALPRRVCKRLTDYTGTLRSFTLQECKVTRDSDRRLKIHPGKREGAIVPPSRRRVNSQSVVKQLPSRLKPEWEGLSLGPEATFHPCDHAIESCAFIPEKSENRDAQRSFMADFSMANSDFDFAHHVYEKHLGSHHLGQQSYPATTVILPFLTPHDGNIDYIIKFPWIQVGSASIQMTSPGGNTASKFEFPWSQPLDYAGILLHSSLQRQATLRGSKDEKFFNKSTI